jgi:hypothetical protein
MIDLKNTYIENDFGELRDLYITSRNAGTLSFYKTTPLYSGNFIWSGDDDHLGFASEKFCIEQGCRKVTLADLKPRTKVRYVLVGDESIFSLKEDFEKGNLYDGPIHTKVTREAHLISSWNNGILYRRVEKELTWWDELKVNYAFKRNDSGLIVMKDESAFTDVNFISMCHLVASMTDKPQ